MILIRLSLSRFSFLQKPLCVQDKDYTSSHASSKLPRPSIFIRLVNANNSRTPSKRSRCARFRVTLERSVSKLLCVLQFTRINTYRRFRRVMIARMHKETIAMVRSLFDSVRYIYIRLFIKYWWKDTTLSHARSNSSLFERCYCERNRCFYTAY